jgi:hypothetical protein
MSTLILIDDYYLNPLGYNRGLFTQTSSSTPITNTTAELSLIDGGVGSLTVPTNAFKVGDTFRVKMTGHIQCTNNQTLTIQIKAGPAVILANTGAISLQTTSGNVRHFALDIEMVIRTLGVAGIASIATGGSFQYNRSGAGGSIEGTNFSVENITTFDTTISNTLQITGQWGSASASNSIFSEIFTLTKVY